MVVLIFGLPLVLAAIFAPYLGASEDLLVNQPRLKVMIVNLDAPTSPINAALQTFFRAASSSSATPLPEFVPEAFTNVNDVKSAVEDAGTYWGAVVVNPNAYAKLMAAVMAAPNASLPAYAGYSSSSALTFIWDEGRSPTIAPRMASPLRTLLSKFTSIFAGVMAQSLAQQPGGTTLIGRLAAGAPTLLASPVGYTEANIHPAGTMPTAVQALTVGVVMVLVLSLGAAKIATQYVGVSGNKPAYDAPTDTYVTAADGIHGRPISWRTAAARIVAMLASSAALAGMYAVLVVGIDADGTYKAQGGAESNRGNGWAGIWGTMILFSCTITWFLAGWIELVGDTNITVLFLPVAYYNVLAGWNLDLAPNSYQFFQYAPVYHVDRLLRFHLFGSLSRPSQIGEAVGVLIAWSVVGVIFYLLASLFVKPTLRRMLTAREQTNSATKNTTQLPVKTVVVASAPSSGTSSDVRGKDQQPADVAIELTPVTGGMTDIKKTTPASGATDANARAAGASASVTAAGSAASGTRAVASSGCVDNTRPATSPTPTGATPPSQAAAANENPIPASAPRPQISPSAAGSASVHAAC